MDTLDKLSSISSVLRSLTLPIRSRSRRLRTLSLSSSKSQPSPQRHRTTLTDLPYEILTEIILYLRPPSLNLRTPAKAYSDLLAFCLINRRLRDVAQPILFESAHLVRRGVIRVRDRRKKLLGMDKRIEGYWNAVKKSEGKLVVKELRARTRLDPLPSGALGDRITFVGLHHCTIDFEAFFQLPNLRSAVLILCAFTNTPTLTSSYPYSLPLLSRLSLMLYPNVPPPPLLSPTYLPALQHLSLAYLDNPSHSRPPIDFFHPLSLIIPQLLSFSTNVPILCPESTSLHPIPLRPDITLHDIILHQPLDLIPPQLHIRLPISLVLPKLRETLFAHLSHYPEVETIILRDDQDLDMEEAKGLIGTFVEGMEGREGSGKEVRILVEEDNSPVKKNIEGGWGSRAFEEVLRERRVAEEEKRRKRKEGEGSY